MDVMGAFRWSHELSAFDRVLSSDTGFVGAMVGMCGLSVVSHRRALRRAGTGGMSDIDADIT